MTDDIMFLCSENPGEYNLVSVVDNCQVLVVTIESEKYKEIKISFSDYLSYRTSYESDRLRSREDNAEKVLGAKYSILSSWKNSEFIKWIEHESLDIQSSKNCSHYEIATVDYIIDVISRSIPEVELFDW